MKGNPINFGRGSVSALPETLAQMQDLLPKELSVRLGGICKSERMGCRLELAFQQGATATVGARLSELVRKE